ncbi:unnamed protein product [Tenebrio molitor]|nr:unnamed protein product [Tenebrio molitor]
MTLWWLLFVEYDTQNPRNFIQRESLSLITIIIISYAVIMYF